MKVFILAGGLGTRLSEDTVQKPKPMLDIGSMPILWHIMKIYSYYGFNEFVILLGYKGYVIKEYFANYFLHQNDVTIDLNNNEMEIHGNKSDPWKVTLLDTGLGSMTGSRIKKARGFVDDDTFLLTYGDGVSNVNIKELLAFHKSHGKIVTMTAIQPEGRFGTVDVDNNNIVSSFIEKPKGDGGWINGGFFVCNKSVFEYIEEGDQVTFENEPLQKLAKNEELMVFKHHDFWKCMDTLRDKTQLNEMWNNNRAKWKVWE
jgi:glucose-1-phosphate cytidylyltransferase